MIAAPSLESRKVDLTKVVRRKPRMRHAHLGILAIAAVLLFVANPELRARSTAPDQADSPMIDIEDVAKFYKLYEVADGRPTPDQLQHDYLDRGSPGLQHLAKLRHLTGVRIAEAVIEHPTIYTDAKSCMAILPAGRLRVTAALDKLRQFYPEAKFPPITIVIGRGKPVGIADASGVIIGLESLCAVKYFNANEEDRFVHVTAHEYAHVQQALAAPALYNKKKPTVLENALIEGSAEFTAELISGDVSDEGVWAEVKNHGKEIETAFVGDEDTTNLSSWFDNGTLTTPGDLGYWVGYRIVKSYYDHAPDKRRALHDILQVANAKAFLNESGWYPGITLK
jgi:hypothetical protein